jgi:uncharacterized protein YjbI with pentapeptide repeats
MANAEHLKLLNQGVKVWNKWIREHDDIVPDLSNADLSGKDLTRVWLFDANLTGANFYCTKLNGAFLSGADCSGADFSKADFTMADLFFSNFSNAKLSWAMLDLSNFSHAKLVHANLSGSFMLCTNFEGADLSHADLNAACMMGTNFNNAILNECQIYGTASWDLKVNEHTIQSGLIISRPDRATVKVDDIEVAQFIYLLLNRKKFRNMLESLTSKAVLILGRFTVERKAVLDAMAEELRKNNLLPVIFDFERCSNLDFTETIKILAGLSLFVIVDITKPKSSPQELTAVVPDYQKPFVPILQEGENKYSMFGDFKKYDWVLQPILKYPNKDILLENFKSLILDRALKKHQEILIKKNKTFEEMSIEEMIALKNGN